MGERSLELRGHTDGGRSNVNMRNSYTKGDLLNLMTEGEYLIKGRGV
jgi:hypothetical protein